MTYVCSISGGGYSHRVTLEILGVTSSHFRMTYEDIHMGSNGPQKHTFTGSIDNTGNNYYYLEVSKYDDTPVENLYFELILLTGKQRLHDQDPIMEVLQCSNSGRFNNDNLEFDAIMLYNPIGYNDYVVSQNETLSKVVKDLSHIKLLRVVPQTI